jgi:hypothetical protein
MRGDRSSSSDVKQAPSSDGAPHAVAWAKRPIAWAALACGLSLALHACGGATPSGSADPRGAAAQGGPGPSGPLGPRRACVDQHTWPECLDYFAQRTALYGELSSVEEERDMRNVPVGLDAIESGDPLLEEVGLEIVGPFADQKGVVEASAKAMLEPSLEVQSLSTSILEKSDAWGRVASQWRTGHGRMNDRSPTDTASPFDASVYQLTVPASATPYPPGDSAISVGFTVDTAPDATLAALGGQPAGSLDDLVTKLKTSAKASLDLDGITKKIQEAAARGDQATVMALTAQVEKTIQAAQAASPDQVPFPTGDAAATAKATILEDQGGIRRWAVAYTEPLYRKTVVIVGWSPAAYPVRAL